MLTRADLKQLAALSGSSAVVSLYLRIDGSRYVRQGYAARLKDLLRQQRQALARRGLSADERAGVLEDFRRLQHYFRTELDRRGTKTVAIFCAGRIGLWRVVRLPVALPSLLTVRRAPYITPLALLLERARAYGALLLDRSAARLFHVVLGPPEELVVVEREAIGARVQVHLSRAEKRLDRHQIEQEHQFYKQVAARAHDYFRAHPCSALVLGGRRELIGVFESFLPTALRELIVERLAIDKDAPLETAAARTRAIREQVELKRKLALVDQLEDRSAHKSGLAAAGARATLNALNLGQVATLLVREGLSMSGARCTDCGSLALPGPRCGLCGQPTEALADLVGEMIARAFQQGAAIEEVPAGSALDQAGRIAALLRFKL
jgi:peptide subunit release factor 1 (eRF1)